MFFTQFMLLAVVFHRGFIRLFFCFANERKTIPESRQSNNDDSESCGPVSPPVNKGLPAILLVNRPCVSEPLGLIPPKIPGSARSQPRNVKKWATIDFGYIHRPLEAANLLAWPLHQQM